MGVARQRRDHLSTKVGCTCAIGEVGVSSVDPAVSRDRDSPCDRRAFESAFPTLADPQVSHPGNRSIARSRVLFTNGRGVKTRIKRAATNAEVKIKVRRWTIEIYRSIVRVRDDIARRRASWKFYQYRGSHLVLLAVAREKLRAERQTIDRGCCRASRSTNRRGLSEQEELEAIDYEQHVSTRDNNTECCEWDPPHSRKPKVLRDDISRMKFLSFDVENLRKTENSKSFFQPVSTNE